MPYGERRPQLVSNVANPWGPFWTKVKASATKPNNMQNPQKAVWRIEKNEWWFDPTTKLNAIEYKNDWITKKLEHKIKYYYY